MITAEQIRMIVEEIERRFRERTPAKSAYDGLPEYRVVRSEMWSFAREHGIDIPLPGQDDEYDRAVFQLYDRLRKEFPTEPWEPRRNWTAATKQRRKELGLK